MFVILLVSSFLGPPVEGMMSKVIPETHGQLIGMEVLNLNHLGAPFSNPTYSIEWPKKLGHEVPYGWVNIDTQGVVRVAKKFDYEALPEGDKNIRFTVVIKEKDKTKPAGTARGYYSMMASKKEIREWKHKVVLRILDENDEKPHLFLPENGMVRIAENVEQGDVVYTFTAEDRDEDSKLRYQIDGLDCGSQFGIRETSGELYAVGNGFSGRCELEVIVTDVASCTTVAGCQTDSHFVSLISTRYYSRNTPKDATPKTRSVVHREKCPPLTEPDPSNPGSCIQIPEACQSKPCMNGGTCVSNYKSQRYLCICVLGWAGHRCEIPPKSVQIYNLTVLPRKPQQAFLKKETVVYKKKSSEECMALNHQCSRTEGEAPCSGRGKCECGRCWCPTALGGRTHWYGEFCECRSWACPRGNGRLCSGNGICDCGKCSCSHGWSGEACECNTSQKLCYPPLGGTICSGRGSCKCGRCVCEKGWGGSACHCRDSLLRKDSSTWSMLFCKPSDFVPSE